MTEYVYEYGKRWDVRVPRGDIKFLLARAHVNSTDDEIAADIRNRCTAPGFTLSLKIQSVKYALICHKRNRDLYNRVVSGRI